MADEEREIAIRITGKSETRPGTQQTEEDLARVRRSTEQTEQASRKLQTQWRLMQQQAIATANGAGALYVDLNRVNGLTQQFGGGPAIRNAETYAAAVARAGGAAKLTAAEQSQVNTVVTAAIQKYQAIGQSAPAHLLDLQRATTQVEQKTGLLHATWTKMASAFAVGSLVDRAVSGLFSLGREVFTTSGQIVDLSAKTGLSTTAVQKYGYAARQTGGELTQWADAVFKLGVNIENGGAKAQHGLQALGLEYEVIRRMRPEDQFDAIMRSLASVESPQERNRIGVELMGKSYANVAAAVSDYIDLQKQAPVASEAAVRANDIAADAIGGTWDAAVIHATNAIGSVLAAFQRGRKEIGEQQAYVVAQGINYLSGAFPALAIGLSTAPTERRAPQPDIALPAATGADAMRTYTQRLAEAQRELQRLTPATRAQIDAAVQLGESMDRLADKYGLSDDSARLYQATTKRTTQALKEATRERDQLNQASERLQAQTIGRLVSSGEAASKRIAEAFMREARARAAANASSEKAQVDMINGLVNRGEAASRVIGQNFLATIRLENETAAMRDMRSLSSYNQQIYEIQEWARVTKAQFVGTEDEARRFYTAIDDMTKEKIASVSKSWKHFFGDDLMKVLAGAFQGGGNIGQAVGASVGAQTGGWLERYLGDALDADNNVIQGKLTRLLPDKMAKGVEMALPFVGGLIGSMAGKLVSKIADIFTGGEAARANDLRDELKARFGDAAGAGLQDLVSKYGNLGSVQGAYKGFMTGGSRADVQGSFDDLQKAIADADALLEKYGLTLDSLRPANERFAESVQRMATEYFDLKAMGFGDGQIARGAAAGMNDLLRAAIETREKLPGTFLPMIEELARSGLIAADVRAKLLGISDAAVPWKEMEQIATDLNIPIQHLGPNFQAAKIGETADQWAAKLILLRDNGADYANVLTSQKDRANEFLKAALQWGAELPPSMKPILEAMERQGLLLDNNNDGIDDLSQVKFGKTQAEQFDPLIKALNDLVDVFKTGLPNGLDELRRNAGLGITVPVTVERRDQSGNSDPDDPHRNQTDHSGAPGLARGGLVKRHTLAHIAEAGSPEIVGDVGFMTRAVRDAMRQIQAPAPNVDVTALSAAIATAVEKGVSAALGRSGGQKPVNVTIELGGKALDARIEQVTRTNAARGLLQIPKRAVTVQVPHG